MPFTHTGSGAQPSLEKPLVNDGCARELSPLSCRAPLGVGLGGETLPWTKSKGKHMLGAHIPKTGCGVGAWLTFPALTSACSWQSCSPTPNPQSQPWGLRDCPGMVPALSSWPLLGQATGPAWKNPIRPSACQERKMAEAVGSGGAGAWSRCAVPSP